VTFPVVALAVASVVERWQLALPLGKCSCCHRAFTCYPPGFYPRRQYQLDVVAEVVAGVALGELRARGRRPADRVIAPASGSGRGSRRSVRMRNEIHEKHHVTGRVIIHCVKPAHHTGDHPGHGAAGRD
jgi:hypothetical protein